MFCRLLERGFRNDDVEGLEEVLNGELTEGILPSIDDCETALVRASALGFKQSVSRLLAHGCDPDCQDPDGETPLHAAAANGHLGGCIKFSSPHLCPLMYMRWSLVASLLLH